jgi:hypothetical protein
LDGVYIAVAWQRVEHIRYNTIRILEICEISTIFYLETVKGTDHFEDLGVENGEGNTVRPH